MVPAPSAAINPPLHFGAYVSDRSYSLHCGAPPQRMCTPHRVNCQLRDRLRWPVSDCPQQLRRVVLHIVDCLPSVRCCSTPSLVGVGPALPQSCQRDWLTIDINTIGSGPGPKVRAMAKLSHMSYCIGIACAMNVVRNIVTGSGVPGTLGGWRRHRSRFCRALSSLGGGCRQP